MVGWRGVQSTAFWLLFIKYCEECTMGTEKNDASVAPIPAPPVTPAVPGPPMPAGAGVAFTPVSAQGKKRMKLIGILVGVLVVLVIAGDCWCGGDQGRQ